MDPQLNGKAMATWHIILHTQYFPPETGAPQARLFALARNLNARGHQVTVLTAIPNYPGGKLFPGYGGLVSRDSIQGIKVLRTAIYPTQSVSVLPRLANYFSFLLSSLLAGGWLLPRADFLITESPPLLLGISGYLLSRWKKARWIFNVADLWPESAVRLGIIRPGLALSMSKSLEAFCYRKAWAVTGQSNTILADIRQRFPDVRTHLFSNAVDTQIFCPSARPDASPSSLRENGSLILLYAGLHGLAQGLEQIIYAARQLADLDHLKFVFVGDGPEKGRLVSLAESFGLTNSHFLEPVPARQMPSILASADIVLIALKTYLLGAVPSKLYEAMACGKPVIIIAEGEAANIVSGNNCGLVVKPDDSNGLEEAIRSLVTNPAMRKRMGRFGRKAAQKHFNQENVLAEFAAFLGSG